MQALGVEDFVRGFFIMCYCYEMNLSFLYESVYFVELRWQLRNKKTNRDKYIVTLKINKLVLKHTLIFYC